MAGIALAQQPFPFTGSPWRTALRAVERSSRCEASSPPERKKNPVIRHNSDVPVWERLHRQALQKRYSEKLREDGAVLDREASALQLSSSAWEAKWKQMLAHKESQRRTRDRLKQHMDYLKLLEDSSECYFHPRVPLTNSEEVSNALSQIAAAQQRLKAAVNDCDNREQELKEQIERRLRECWLRCDSEEAAEKRLRQEAADLNTAPAINNLIEQRLDLLHEATRLEIVYKHYESHGRSSFDKGFSRKLRESKWFERLEKGVSFTQSVVAEEIQNIGYAFQRRNKLFEAAFAKVRPERSLAPRPRF